MQEDITVFLREVRQAYQAQKKQSNNFNVLIIGKTGVGKSTLVNALFGKYLSETGVGRPITQNIAEYHKKGFPITVYDTPGLEMSAETNQQLRKEVAHILSDGYQEDSQKKIHIVFYCINDRTSRFEKSEEDWIKEIANMGIPIILVLTQTLSKKNSEFLTFLKDKNLPVRSIIPILAESLMITEEYSVQAHGLDNLAKVTAENLLEDSPRKTFVSKQIVNIDLQEEEANRYFNNYINDLSSSKGLQDKNFLRFIKELAEVYSNTSSFFGFNDDNLWSIILDFIKKVAWPYLNNTWRRLRGQSISEIEFYEEMKKLNMRYIDLLKKKKKAEFENRK